MRARVGKKERLTRVAVRLPERLHHGLAQLAAAQGRSLNYEITVRLEASIELDKLVHAKTTIETMQIIDKLKRRLVDLRLAGEDD
jgi:predicted DNA-binding protein